MVHKPVVEWSNQPLWIWPNPRRMVAKSWFSCLHKKNEGRTLQNLWVFLVFRFCTKSWPNVVKLLGPSGPRHLDFPVVTDLNGKRSGHVWNPETNKWRTSQNPPFFVSKLCCCCCCNNNNNKNKNKKEQEHYFRVGVYMYQNFGHQCVVE